MKKGLWHKATAVLLVMAMICSMTACGGVGGPGIGGNHHDPVDCTGTEQPDKTDYQISATNLMTDIRNNGEQWIQSEYNPDPAQTDVADFAVRLFQQSLEDEKNTLISPVSVLMALAMTANGAKENTLAQMEEIFGLNQSELNEYLWYYMNALSKENVKYNISNSIWMRDAEFLHVEEDFLKKNFQYYNADVYKAPFDNTTLEDINHWVENKTDGLIKDVLDQIPTDAIMYLINALIFEAEWAEVYEESQVRDKTFTTENGQKQNVELMYSMENQYLENEDITGFIKYYKNRKYAFVALLPKEGKTVQQCVEGLSGANLRDLLANPVQIPVDAALPAFKTEYSVLLNDVLKEMGMADAFDGGKADFTGLGTSDRGNIFIGRVIHKTYIEMSPKGTKAGAATVVEMMDECAPWYEEMKTVHLDRPFIYMLIDCENNQPFFMGTCMSVEADCGME
ncbi:MAG: serpin family protein [Agathobacter sp.]|nr:serpin family protein [Agathobacter sp.]